MGIDNKKDKQARDDETPQHKVILLEFQIAKYPITNTQYRDFVQAYGHQAPMHWQNGQIPDGKDQHPVVSITWQAAEAFCGWANVRLPSEAEWEKAARGTDGWIWPWGNEFDKTKCHSLESMIFDTTPVDRYPQGASPYGLLDMAGNVTEWTSSLWKPYPYKADDGREGPMASGSHTLRSGSWLTTLRNLPAAPAGNCTVHSSGSTSSGFG